jgi:hypothetical protein
MDDDVFTIECSGGSLKVTRKLLLLRRVPISLFRLISVLNVFSRSPVFRDAIAISPDKQTDDRKLALDDRRDSLLLMFDLMDNFGRRKRQKAFKDHPSSAYVDIPSLSDKYDVMWLPWVMRGHLWEACTSYHSDWVIFTYEIAYKLKWRELALHAVHLLDDCEMPSQFTVERARSLGVDAYHCLVAAVEESGSDDWVDIADYIKLPEE